jgi:hypothetical protein
VRVAGYGVSVEVPAGWEARITKRGSGPVLHLATFPLYASDGDFGAAATGRMSTGDVFAALVEYRDRAKMSPRVGLFAPVGLPSAPRADEFAPMQLQVTRVGQLGWQRFFTAVQRTCCLYAVINPGHEPPGALVRRLWSVLATLRLDTMR